MIIRYRKALRNEKDLQIQFNKENDERMKAIRAKAGMPMVLIFSVVIIAACIIIGYSSPVIFYTLIATAGLQLAAAGVVKFIFTNKM